MKDLFSKILAKPSQGAKPSAAQDVALLNALKDQDAFQIKNATERKKAAAQYNEESALGLLPGMNFLDFVTSGKAPGYTAASKNVDNIGATIQAIQSQISGPMAAQITKDRALLNKGQDQMQDYPG